MMSFIKQLTASCLIVALIGCQAKPPPSRNNRGSDQQGSTSWDPTFAEARVLAPVALVEATEESSLKVPKISIQLKNADYMWVLRCQKSFKTKTSTGEDARTISTSNAGGLSQLKWFWQEAFGSTNACVQVGNHITRGDYEDVAAESGEFFYIINPCVSKETSTKFEQCSYRLAFTESFKYTNSLSSEFINAAKKLADAESILSGHYSRLYGYAQSIQMNQDSCEQISNLKKARANFWNGIKSILTIGVSAAVGALVTGGTGAIAGVKVGLNLSKMLFGSKRDEAPLECPMVKEYESKWVETAAKVDSAAQTVVDLRVKLGELDSKYAKLDASILKNAVKTETEQ